MPHNYFKLKDIYLSGNTGKRAAMFQYNKFYDAPQPNGINIGR